MGAASILLPAILAGTGALLTAASVGVSGYIVGICRRDQRIDQTIDGVHHAVSRLDAMRVDLQRREDALAALPGDGARVAAGFGTSAKISAVFTTIDFQGGDAFAFALSPHEARRLAGRLIADAAAAEDMFGALEAEIFGHASGMRESTATGDRNDAAGFPAGESAAQPSPIAAGCETRVGDPPGAEGDLAALRAGDVSELYDALATRGEA